MTVMTTTQLHVCVCVCVSCARSLVESDNRTVILVKPPALPRLAPHIFHLTMSTRFASFSPRLLFLLRGDEEWGSINLYRTELTLSYSFHSFLLSFCFCLEHSRSSIFINQYSDYSLSDFFYLLICSLSFFLSEELTKFHSETVLSRCS